MFKKVSDLLGQDQFKKSSKGYYKKSSKPTELFDFLTLIAKWHEIVGEKLAKVTVPLKNQNKTLTVLTNHSAYSQSLSMMEETIKDKIFRSFPELRGKIQRLNFMVSTQHFDRQREDLLKRASSQRSSETQVKKQTTLHPQSPKYKALKEEALKEFADLEGDLKEQMISIYIQSRSE
jgi:flagellar biosynthesis component FlhA